jgi:soluble lytic murein transglycosylase-like protein
MRKISLTAFTILLCALGAAAQSRSNYSFDNFSSGGVTVFSPAKPAAKPAFKTFSSKKKGKKGEEQRIAATNAPVAPAVKRTAQRTSNVQDSLALADVYKSSVTNNTSVKMAPGATKSMHGFTTGDSAIDSYIINSCARYGIDPLLIYAQMHQESSFKFRALSNKGASGLMQLMPGTARRFGVTNIFDPSQNIDGGVKYMRYLLDMFNGDIDLALAGYNAGEGAVQKYGWSIPPYNETQEYVRRISARYDMLRNPNTPRSAMRVSSTNLAQLEKKETTTPLSLYEKAIYAVKTPDGRMRLVSQ